LMTPGDHSAHVRLCLDRLRGGDAAARDELLAHAAERLRRLARKLLRDDFARLRRWEETDDIFQNAPWPLYRAPRGTVPATAPAPPPAGSRPPRRRGPPRGGRPPGPRAPGPPPRGPPPARGPPGRPGGRGGVRRQAPDRRGAGRPPRGRHGAGDATGVLPPRR